MKQKCIYSNNSNLVLVQTVYADGQCRMEIKDALGSWLWINKTISDIHWKTYSHVLEINNHATWLNLTTLSISLILLHFSLPITLDTASVHYVSILT